MSETSDLHGVKSVGVVGAGQMGMGIAQVCAAAGLRVTLSDVSPERTAAGIDSLASRLEKQVRAGKLDGALRDALLGRIQPTELEGHAAADLVIEAVSENEALKLELFRRLDDCVSENALLATNTS